MRATALFAALISADLASAVLQLSFAKQVAKKPAKTTTSRRRDDAGLSAQLWWAEWTYVVNVTVGTPGQPVSLVISPSAVDTWVPDYHSYDCTEYSDDYYCKWGTFEYEDSSSYKAEAPYDYDSYYSDSDYNYFSYDYSDGNYGYGSYMTDVIDLGGIGVSNFTMGLVNETSRWIGTLGIGYNDSTYSNLPDRLFESGLINSTAYSIWLDDEEASTGSLLFGAVDTSKYSGNLTRINASKYSSGYSSSFGIYLYSINGSSDGSSSPVNIESEDLPVSISISPSDAISILPTELTEQIWKLTGAVYDEDWERAYISCDAATSNQTFTFQLGGTEGPIIEATMADLVIPQDQWDQSPFSYGSDSDDDLSQCLFGIQNSSFNYYSYYDYYSLGSTLLRRTYAVFDLVNEEVAVAPVVFGSGEGNVVPFPVYGATIPSATLKCSSYGCYTGTATSYTGSGNGGSGGSGTSGDGDIGFGGSSKGGLMSVGAVVGAALGGGLGALAFGGAVLLMLRSRRRNKEEPSSEYAAEVVNRGQGSGAPAADGEQAVTRANEKAPEAPLPAPPPPVVLPRIPESEEARRSQEEASGSGHGNTTNV